MKDYLVEVGTTMRQLSESQGRTETNLIDALNVAYDYGSDQEEITDHLLKQSVNFGGFQSKRGASRGGSTTVGGVPGEG